MKICGINNYPIMHNNQFKNQPAFKGVYVIRGDWKDVHQVGKKIIFEEKKIEGITERSGIPLTSIYSDSQPNTQFLIATNEHVQNIRDYIAIYAPIIKGRFLMLGFIGTDTPPLKQKILRKLVNINIENEAEYKWAEDAMERGNFDPMTDILKTLKAEAKETLQRFQFCSSVPMDEIRILEAEDVLHAMENNTFDYVEGKILE